MSMARCSDARIPVTTTSCSSCCGCDDLGVVAGASAGSAANNVLPKAMEPNVKPDSPNLVYVALSAAAREAQAALRNAFRRVFRLIRNPPQRKMLQARNDRLRRVSGAVRYMKIVWNPLNIVSHALRASRRGPND